MARTLGNKGTMFEELAELSTRFQEVPRGPDYCSEFLKRYPFDSTGFECDGGESQRSHPTFRLLDWYGLCSVRPSG
jgi:hypothetical protein